MPKGEHWAHRRHLMPKRYCAQCGEEIKPQHRLHRRAGGKDTMEWYWPKKYCSNKCVGMAAHLRQLGKARGRFKDKSGYILLSTRVGENGYQQPEHRAVMEQMEGRKLRKNETVHHKDGNRANNHPDNLELWSGRHGRGQRVGEQDIWSGMIPKWVLENDSPY